MASHLYNATIQTITAKNNTEFAICREVLSALYGIGVRKRFPNKADVLNNQKNPAQLVTYDTINVVDISLSDDSSLELDPDVSNDRFRDPEFYNYLRWQWNSVSRHCTSTIRCSPLVVSNNRDAIMSFLEKFKVDITKFTTTSFHGWSVGSRIFGEGELFEITSIDRNNKQAHIVCVTSSENNKIISLDNLSESYVLM